MSNGAKIDGGNSFMFSGRYMYFAYSTWDRKRRQLSNYGIGEHDPVAISKHASRGQCGNNDIRSILGL